MSYLVLRGAPARREGVIGRCGHKPEEISALLYALVLSIVHEDDWGIDDSRRTTDLLLELIAAFCLGEIVLLAPDWFRPTAQSKEGARP
jgi:hypothetical protein